MALYGSSRDIGLFRSINNELLRKIIQQQVGYYKIDLIKTQVNLYEEATSKVYKDPVLIECLIERNDQSFEVNEFGTSVSRIVNFKFLRDTLVEKSLLPEVGDIILWEDNFYEIDNLIENQLLLGQNPSYSYSEDTDTYGSSWSIVLEGHYTRPEKLGIVKQR